MVAIFVDSHYLVAMINQRDQWHKRALDLSFKITGSSFIVTDSVFVETLNYFAEIKPEIKGRAVDAINIFSTRPNVTVIEQTSVLMNSGIELYKSRLDKGFSLTDCISMVVSREHNITKILTHDHHFQQEGFQILL